jgi:hypothetical protein
MIKHRSTRAVQAWFRANGKANGVCWLKRAARTTAAALLVVGAFPAQTGMAEEPAATAVIKPGDFAASTFAGVKLQVEALEPNVDPLTKTVIDVDGVTLRIYNGSTLGAPMSGQPVSPAAVDFAAKDVGHVFGLAFDPRPASDTVSPALYAAATSAFGLHISGPDANGDGKPDRLLKGAPGAVFMDGLFGAGSGPGTIYKIDHATGKVARFADVSNNGSKNGGAGLGALALEPASGTLYVSDLDSGLIHRFSTGAAPVDLGQFDHGVAARPAAGKPAVKDDGKTLDITSPAFDTADPATWGMTQRERRVGGLALDKGRLFYSVAEGPEIWSVGLEADGAFKTDARLELGLKSETSFPVASIAFDSAGRMILAERGTVTNPANFSAFVAAGPARVLRFTLEDPDDAATPGLWKPAAEEYAIGNAAAHRDAAGGVAIQHAYNADGTINPGVCGGTLIASSAALGAERKEHGLQLNPIDSIRTGDVLGTDHVYINLKPALDDAEGRGFAGGVAVLQDCSGGSAFPPVADAGAGFPPVTEGGDAFPPVAGGGGDGGDAVFPPVTDDSTLDPGGGGKAVLTVTKTALVDKCSPKGGCAFTIEVRNDTAEDIAGPIVLSEDIEAPQALLTGEPNEPWSCTKAAPFKCAHPGPVPANGKLDMRVVFAPNTPPEAKEVRNCARVADAKDAAQAGGPEVGDECATVSLDPNAPVQAGPIVVAKKGAGKCTAKGPCAFTISVTNTSAFEISDFVIDDQIDAPKAVLASDPKAPWTCTKVAPFSCTHKGPLASKATVNLDLSFTPNTPPEKKELKNCAIPPLMGVGGKNPGGPQQQPKQIAPGKKSDLFDFRRHAPLISPASFRGQSYASGHGLLHLVGGAGGNIGGVTNKCLKFGPPPAFSLQQADGTAITFTNVSIDAAGNLRGNASLFSGRKGTIDGTFNGSLVSFRLRWSDGTIGDYTARIDANGVIAGQTRDIAGGPNVKFNGLQPWKCERNEVCDTYSKDAAETAKKFNKLSCGPDEPPGRWASDVDSHLAFCMGQPPTSTFLNSETVARSDLLKKCEADRAAFCPAYVVDALVLAKDFEARQCTEQHGGYMSTDPAAQQKFCLEESRGNLDSTAKSRKILLDTCIARLAKVGGDAATGIGGSPDGGGNALGEPSPEQCAVVPIDPEAVVPPLPPLETATAANGLQISKAATPGTTCTKANCTFTLGVKNTTAAPIAGPIKIIDNSSVVLRDGQAGAPLTTKLVSPPPAPWTCTKPNQFQFECSHPGPIAPGETKTFDLAIDLATEADVATIKNCGFLDENTAVCADATTSAPVPPPLEAPVEGAQNVGPTADVNGLVLTKRRGADKCSDLGGGCAFIVRITNSGLAEFNDPIEFTDVIKTADGQALPNAALEAQPLLTLGEGAAAAIACTKAGDTVTCGTGGANAKIPPGQFIDVKLTMKPGPAGGATAVRNCAVLKSGGGQSCSNMALVNGPIVRATKFGGGDTCLPRCTFAVVIQNVGNTDAKGAFKFKDTFTPVSSLGGYTVQPGTGECSRLGDEFFCVPSVNVLKPGELTSVVITVFGTAKAPEYRNCVDFVPQPQAPKESLVLDDKNDGRCVTVKDTSPQTPNLVIRKQAPNRQGASSDGHCDLKSACRFTITVTNTGLAPFTGPLRVTDTVSRGIPQFISIGPGSPQSLPWKCDSVQNGGAIAQSSITCELPPLPNGLAPGTTATLEVAVTPGATWKGSDTLKNCVEITSDGDIGANAQKADCAEVKLDPFAVSVEKTGDKACPPGSNCTFKITLRNPGPINHNAPVTITDALRQRVTAQIVSITPPLPCATQPTEIPFTCTSPGPVRLDLDAAPGTEFGPREFTMVVKMPSDGSADVYTNCIFVADGDGGAQSEPACHNVSTKPIELSISKTAASTSCDEATPCNFNIKVSNASAKDIPGPITINDLTRIGRTPLTNVKLVSASAPWTCLSSAAPGMQCSHPGPVPANGALDLALSLQPLAGSLTSATEVRNCAGLAGESAADANACAIIPVKTTAPTPPVTPTCAGGMVLTNGTCACPEFLKWNGRQCVGTGGINMVDPRPGDETNDPVPAKPVTTKPACPEGFIGSPPNCCPRGTEFRNGACRSLQSPPPPPASCPEGFIGSPPNCCPRGTEFRNGACRGPKAPKEVSCPRGQNRDPKTGVCFSCSHNDVFVNGKCVPKKAPPPPPPPQQCPPDRPVGKFPRCCPQNAQFVNGQCRCLPGLQFRRGQCVAVQPAPVNCPQGQILVNGRCRILAIPTPGPKPPRDCGPGYRPLDKPNKYGAFCEAIPTPGPKPPVVKPPPPPPPPPPRKVCPSNATGTPPNCTCRGNADYDPGSNRCFKGPS